MLPLVRTRSTQICKASPQSSGCCTGFIIVKSISFAGVLRVRVRCVRCDGVQLVCTFKMKMASNTVAAGAPGAVVSAAGSTSS
jgi:hypothetical protein